MIDIGAHIHDRAHVDHSVSIGKGAKIWQFASVVRSASVGEYTIVGSCAIIDGAHIGSHCKIGHGASIHPGVVAESHVFIGPGVVICNDAWPRTHQRNWKVIPRCVYIESGASIGANCTILPGVNIGAGAMIAAGVTVRHDVPRAALVLPGKTVQISNEADKIRTREALCSEW